VTRVVHLTSVHSATDVRIFQKECKSLARDGYDVELIVPNAKDEVIDGVRMVGVPGYRNRLSRILRTGWSVYREAVRRNADIYHFHDPELIPWTLLLRLKGHKVIYDAHENLPRMILRKDYLPSFVRRPLGWIVERFENFASQWFSAIIGATPAIERRFVAVNPRTVSILNTAIPAEFEGKQRGPWSHRKLSVAYVGGIQRANCIEEIVAAMSLIPSCVQASLQLAGAFSPESLRDSVTKHPGWQRVEYLGLVKRACVPMILGQVRGGLILSPPDPECIESLPNKLFEYMAAGIPVIASDFPRWKEIIEGTQCGVLVDSRRPEQIAEAITYVLTHPKDAEAMGCAGREAVMTRYNWKIEERRLLALYADLCGRS
jgi:glycosyltransferase involved in cell wall biosynthesis